MENEHSRKEQVSYLWSKPKAERDKQQKKKKKKKPEYLMKIKGTTGYISRI
jgi:hypothetical protein